MPTQTTLACFEVADFIAGLPPERVLDFQVSEKAKERVRELLAREREDILKEDEKAELDHFGEAEHIMRLAKAKASQYVAR